MAELTVMKIQCKDGDKLYVAIRGSEVVLAREDPNDKTQQWYMDYSKASRVTNNNGQRAFALVNKASGQALVNKDNKLADGCVQVLLAPYTDDGHLDISMFWTMVEKVYGDGFHQIATLRNNSLVLDGLKGNCKEGTILGVDPSHLTYLSYVNGNQLWKILPDRAAMAELPAMKILCRDGDNLYVSIRGSEIVLAREDPNDKTQQWFVDYSRANYVTDNNGLRAFALVNKASGQALVNKDKKRADGCVQVQLAPYSDDGYVDISMFWTMVEEVYGQGRFQQIATLRDSSLVIDGLKAGCKEGTIVGVDPSHFTYMAKVNDNQLWKILPVSGSGTTAIPV